MSKKYPAKIGRSKVESMEFGEAETEKLELVREHMGLKQNSEVIRALIFEKCDEIKHIEETQRKRRLEDSQAMDYLEKGEYACPM